MKYLGVLAGVFLAGLILGGGGPLWLAGMIGGTFFLAGLMFRHDNEEKKI